MSAAADRRCSCGASARCVGITIERAKGIAVGRAYTFRCETCRAQFRVHGWGAVAFALFATLVLVGAGVLLTLHPPGSAVGAENENRWFGYRILGFGGIGALFFVARLIARVRHPAVD